MPDMLLQAGCQILTVEGVHLPPSCLRFTPGGLRNNPMISTRREIIMVEMAWAFLLIIPYDALASAVLAVHLVWILCLS
jgi:hypothetical protein